MRRPLRYWWKMRSEIFRLKGVILPSGLMLLTALCFLVLLGSMAKVSASWRRTRSSPPKPLPGGAYFQEIEAQSAGSKVRIYAVIFNEKKCRLRVIDNPVSETQNLEAALSRGGYFAGVNGGYFHETFQPAGLVISDRKILHSFEKARLLSGVLEMGKYSIRLVRSDKYRASKHVTDALQAGPFLIENGGKIRGLNEIRMARRTIVASDGAGNWALISMTPVTLAQAGDLLRTPGLFPKWRPWHALNLDGGSSTAFWAATQPSPFAIREFGTVKNFLGLKPVSKAD